MLRSGVEGSCRQLKTAFWNRGEKREKEASLKEDSDWSICRTRKRTTMESSYQEDSGIINL